MEVSSVESILCPQCLAAVPAAATICHACGAAMSTRSGLNSQALTTVEAPANAQPIPATVRLQDRRWFVLAIVFGAALFLGYPILWNCPSFSRREKVVLSVLVAVETVVLFWGFYLVMRWSYYRVVDSL